ncbi:MAG: hypothetical protein FWB72_03430 [Firmicutes bacterium]|nr:hypothetical protein [Bacillota bacterium]
MASDRRIAGDLLIERTLEARRLLNELSEIERMLLVSTDGTTAWPGLSTLNFYLEFLQLEHLVFMQRFDGVGDYVVHAGRSSWYNAMAGNGYVYVAFNRYTNQIVGISVFSSTLIGASSSHFVRTTGAYVNMTTSFTVGAATAMPGTFHNVQQMKQLLKQFSVWELLVLTEIPHSATWPPVAEFTARGLLPISMVTGAVVTYGAMVFNGFLDAVIQHLGGAEGFRLMLQPLVDEALTLNQANYHETSWARLQAHLSTAQTLLADSDPTVLAMRTALMNLQNALNSMAPSDIQNMPGGYPGSTESLQDWQITQTIMAILAVANIQSPSDVTPAGIEAVAFARALFQGLTYIQQNRLIADPNTPPATNLAAGGSPSYDTLDFIALLLRAEHSVFMHRFDSVGRYVVYRGTSTLRPTLMTDGAGYVYVAFNRDTSEIVGISINSHYLFGQSPNRAEWIGALGSARAFFLAFNATNAAPTNVNYANGGIFPFMQLFIGQNVGQLILRDQLALNTTAANFRAAAPGIVPINGALITSVAFYNGFLNAVVEFFGQTETARERLNATFTSIQQASYQQSDFTVGTWAEFASAVEVARGVLANSTASLAQLNEARANLILAHEALENWIFDYWPGQVGTAAAAIIFAAANAPALSAIHAIIAVHRLDLTRPLTTAEMNIVRNARTTFEALTRPQQIRVLSSTAVATGAPNQAIADFMGVLLKAEHIVFMQRFNNVSGFEVVRGISDTTPGANSGANYVYVAINTNTRTIEAVSVRHNYLFNPTAPNAEYWARNAVELQRWFAAGVANPPVALQVRSMHIFMEQFIELTLDRVLEFAVLDAAATPAVLQTAFNGMQGINPVAQLATTQAVPFSASFFNGVRAAVLYYLGAEGLITDTITLRDEAEGFTLTHWAILPTADVAGTPYQQLMHHFEQAFNALYEASPNFTGLSLTQIETLMQNLAVAFGNLREWAFPTTHASAYGRALVALYWAAVQVYEGLITTGVNVVELRTQKNAAVALLRTQFTFAEVFPVYLELGLLLYGLLEHRSHFATRINENMNWMGQGNFQVLRQSTLHMLEFLLGELDFVAVQNVWRNPGAGNLASHFAWNGHWGAQAGWLGLGNATVEDMGDGDLDVQGTGVLYGAGRLLWLSTTHPPMNFFEVKLNTIVALNFVTPV